MRQGSTGDCVFIKAIFPKNKIFEPMDFSDARELFKSMEATNKINLKKSIVEKINSVKNAFEGNPEIKYSVIDQLKSILPIVIPESDRTIELPVYNEEGEWDTVTYTVEKISLSPVFIPHKYQVDAIALTPISNSNKHQSMLIFPPTLPPGTRGSWLTIFSDFFPFASIGWPLTRSNDQLNKWIDLHGVGSRKGLQVIAASLGGALALEHCSRAAMGKIEKITLFNPALPWFLSKIACKNIEVFYDADDPVKMAGGQVPEAARVTVVDASVTKRGYWYLDKLHAHIRISLAATHEKTIYPAHEYNKSNRTLKSFILYWLVRPMLFIPHLFALVICCISHYCQGRCLDDPSAKNLGHLEHDGLNIGVAVNNTARAEHRSEIKNEQVSRTL